MSNSWNPSIELRKLLVSLDYPPKIVDLDVKWGLICEEYKDLGILPDLGKDLLPLAKYLLGLLEDGLDLKIDPNTNTRTSKEGLVVFMLMDLFKNKRTIRLSTYEIDRYSSFMLSALETVGVIELIDDVTEDFSMD